MGFSGDSYGVDYSNYGLTLETAADKGAAEFPLALRRVRAKAASNSGRGYVRLVLTLLLNRTRLQS